MSPTIITEILIKVFERLAPTVENQTTLHENISLTSFFISGFQDRHLRPDVAVHGAEQRRVVRLQQGGGGTGPEF